jgi:hypothetical protein
MRNSTPSKGHRLKQCRFTGARLSDYVDVRKAIFVFDAEDPVIVPKIDASKLNSVKRVHIADISSVGAKAATRSGFLPNERHSQTQMSSKPFRIVDESAVPLALLGAPA